MSGQSSEFRPNGTDFAAQLTEYIERALLIVLGATVTVIAGFLSQVWGSATPAFQVELATFLNSFGTLFTAAFVMPVLRFAVDTVGSSDERRGRRARVAWCAVAVSVFVFYSILLTNLGETILRYAKAPS